MSEDHWITVDLDNQNDEQLARAVYPEGEEDTQPEMPRDFSIHEFSILSLGERAGRCGVGISYCGGGEQRSPVILGGDQCQS